MSLQDPRLRGDPHWHRGKWPLGQIPDSLLYALGSGLAHRLAVGDTDITGDQFGTLFADAISGVHMSKPVGIADVSWQASAWSVKTIKTTATASPFDMKGKKVRLISGRNSPDYSHGIRDSHKDPVKTAESVIAIWNKRLRAALEKYREIRIAVLVRNMKRREFLLFEEEAVRFDDKDYRWSFNDKDVLEGWRDGHKSFVWQPHGSQFTMIRRIPGSARGFQFNQQIPTLPEKDVLKQIGYQQDWVSLQ